MFEINNLASDVKFDPIGQRSHKQNVSYLNKGLYREEIY